MGFDTIETNLFVISAVENISKVKVVTSKPKKDKKLFEIYVYIQKHKTIDPMRVIYPKNVI